MLNNSAEPRPRRIAALHPEALGDLADGYFHLLTNFAEDWSLGLISAENPRPEDLPLVRQAAQAGADILRLESCHLLTLYRSRDLGTRQHWVGTEVRCLSGNRYFLTVAPVDHAEGFDDDED